jgi:hypothetical protein
MVAFILNAIYRQFLRSSLPGMRKVAVGKGTPGLRAMSVYRERGPPSALKGQRPLIFRPVDDIEHHSAPEHFRLEIGGVLLPLGRFPNAKSRLLVQTNKRVVRRQSAADALVHHGETVVCERLIVHQDPINEKAVAGNIQRRLSKYARDHQNVATMVTG